MATIRWRAIICAPQFTQRRQWDTRRQYGAEWETSDDDAIENGRNAFLLWQTANQAFHRDECDEYEKLAAAAEETTMRYPNSTAERATEFQNAFLSFAVAKGERMVVAKYF